MLRIEKKPLILLTYNLKFNFNKIYDLILNYQTGMFNIFKTWRSRVIN